MASGDKVTRVKFVRRAARGVLSLGVWGGVYLTTIIVFPPGTFIAGSPRRAGFHWGWPVRRHRCAVRPDFWGGRDLCEM